MTAAERRVDSLILSKEARLRFLAIFSQSKLLFYPKRGIYIVDSSRVAVILSVSKAVL
jgi:hypothetical protein